MPGERDGDVRWRIEVSGHRAHAISVTPDRSSVLIADGWGVAYRSLSLRRFDLPSGELVAAARLGDAARAFDVAFSSRPLHDERAEVACLG